MGQLLCGSLVMDHCDPLPALVLPDQSPFWFQLVELYLLFVAIWMGFGFMIKGIFLNFKARFDAFFSALCDDQSCTDSLTKATVKWRPLLVGRKLLYGVT